MIIEENRWNNSNRGLVSGFVKNFDKNTQILTLTLISGEEKILSTRELQDKDLSYLIEDSHIRNWWCNDDNKNTFSHVVLPGATNRYVPQPMMRETFPEFNERKKMMNVLVFVDVRPYQNYRRVLITH
jgi:hypothetical protein